MSKHIRGREHLIVAAAWVLVAFVVAALGGQWQAKQMDGTGLGLFVAPGDTLTAGYVKADTVSSQIDSTAEGYVTSSGDARGHLYVENPSVTTADDYWGMYGGWYKTGGGSNYGDFIAGMVYEVIHDNPGGETGGIWGLTAIADNDAGRVGAPGHPQNITALAAYASVSGDTVFGNVIGTYTEAWTTPDTITGNQMALWAYSNGAHVGGTVYNMLLDDDTGTDWGIYQTGTSPNFLWGLGLGDSLTVAGNVHAAYYFGDGSHLTGISGASADTDTVWAHNLWIGEHSEDATTGLHSPYVNWLAQGLLEATHSEGPFPQGSPYLWANNFSYSLFDDSLDVWRNAEAYYGYAGFSGYGQDTTRVGSLVGGEFTAQYSDNSGTKIGKADHTIGAWGVMGSLSMTGVDSIYSASDGAGGMRATVTVPTGTKATGRVQGLYVATSGGNSLDSLIALYLNDGPQTDWGIYQKGTAPNKLNGPLYAVAVHADSFYGDGSHLTGVGGGPGGTSDHGELDSLSLLDDDHRQYLLRADFPDSFGTAFATAWPDSFAAAMTSTIAPAIHDTAQGLRQEMFTSTSFPGAFWRTWWTGPGDYLTQVGASSNQDQVVGVAYDTTTATFVACTTTDIKAYQFTGLGALALTDSIAQTCDGVASAGYPGMFVTHNGYSYAWYATWTVTSEGDLSIVDWEETGYTSAGLAVDPSAHVAYSCALSPGAYTAISWNSSGTITGENSASLSGISVPNCWWVGNGEMFVGYGGTTGIKCHTTNSSTTINAVVETEPMDDVRGLCASSQYLFVGCRNRAKLYSYTRDGGGYITLKDSLATGNYLTKLTCDETHVWVGMESSVTGVVVASVDTAGHMAWTDTLDAPQTTPSGSYYPSMCWAGNTLATGTWGYGIVVYQATDEGITHYGIRAAFHDSTLIQGPVAITADTLPTWPALPGQINLIDGATESHASAGDVAWTATSSRKLKQLNGLLGPNLGAAVLEAIAEMPVHWWRWKRGDTSTQHVGPVAEDFYQVGRLVAPLTATDSTISGEHETAALFLAVKELSRRNDSLTVALDRSERRMARLERAWALRDTTGTRPRRPRIDKPPERPEPQPRRGRK